MIMRSVRRLLTLAVAISGLLVSGASLAAAAEPYPVPPPVVTVDRATIIVGENVVVTGRNFGPGEIVDAIPNFQGAAMGQLGRSARGGLLVGKAASVTADGNGSFSVTIRLDQVGRYVITSTGRVTARAGSVTVRVLPEGSELPVTGNNGSYLGIVLVGSAVLIAGASLMVFARMRRRSSKIES
jgi:hypothetical protein